MQIRRCNTKLAGYSLQRRFFHVRCRRSATVRIGSELLCPRCAEIARRILARRKVGSLPQRLRKS
jgi:hypothetical protein